jgi:NAD(P)-dependent dehydrogenase (short-subunit alcohol dehydrogenase family)
MDGKICIVTGANSGIGMATAEGLAKQGAHVVMACRDVERSKSVQEKITKASGSDKVDLLQLDLGSQKSTRAFAETFLNAYDRLDVLVNNAAVVPTKRQETADGYEAQFGVNHLGPFLLTHLLLDRLKESAPSRIVTVSSMLHVKGIINFDDLQSENSYGIMVAYQQSKLANCLFTFELARKLEGTGVTANCLHPGVVNTGLTRNLPFFLKPLLKIAGLFMLNPDKGAATSLHVATSAELEGVTGKYFDDCKESRYSSKADDREVAEKLWNLSEQYTGIH